ncbi:unnamed protein product [Protopolystoma xenopodis]|uniref:Uncharacterized protein n=1 Tax=Protopolystoma xenopodis TaxID=117903 RepID=A0A3S5CSU7_9PLAT|nr:unnamed protein product [Protopolystoma xenopodis]
MVETGFEIEWSLDTQIQTTLSPSSPSINPENVTIRSDKAKLSTNHFTTIEYPSAFRTGTEATSSSSRSRGTLITAVNDSIGGLSVSSASARPSLPQILQSPRHLCYNVNLSSNSRRDTALPLEKRARTKSGDGCIYEHQSKFPGEKWPVDRSSANPRPINSANTNSLGLQSPELSSGTGLNQKVKSLSASLDCRPISMYLPGSAWPVAPRHLHCSDHTGPVPVSCGRFVKSTTDFNKPTVSCLEQTQSPINVTDSSPSLSAYPVPEMRPIKNDIHSDLVQNFSSEPHHASSSPPIFDLATSVQPINHGDPITSLTLPICPNSLEESSTSHAHSLQIGLRSSDYASSPAKPSENSPSTPLLRLQTSSISAYKLERSREPSWVQVDSPIYQSYLPVNMASTPALSPLRSTKQPRNLQCRKTSHYIQDGQTLEPPAKPAWQVTSTSGKADLGIKTSFLLKTGVNGKSGSSSTIMTGGNSRWIKEEKALPSIRKGWPF